MQMMGGKPKVVEFGTYTPSADVYASQAQIPHGLGVTPDFVMVVADAITASADITVRYIANAYCAKANLIASNKSANGFAAYNTNFVARDTQQMVSENINYTKFLYENYFLVPYYNSTDYLKAGITYHYVVGKFE